jgi:hypothetical protein
MKGNGFLLVAIFGVTVGLVSNATAGPAVTSGPAQPDSGGAVYGPATQIPSGVSPGFNARDSVAGQSGAGAQSNASGNNTSNSSSTTQNPSANSYSNGDVSGNTTSASTLTGHGQEKVVEISDEELAAKAAASQEKSEVTKKFEPSILNAGVATIDQITKASGASASPPSPGQPVGSPIPRATGAPQVSASPQN